MRRPRGMCWRRDCKPGSHQRSAGRGGGRPVRVGRWCGARRCSRRSSSWTASSASWSAWPARAAARRAPAPASAGPRRTCPPRPHGARPPARPPPAPAGAPAPGAAAAAVPAGAPAAGGSAAGGAHAGASSAEREGCGEAPGDPLLRGPAAGGAGEQAAPEADSETPERRREAVRGVPGGGWSVGAHRVAGGKTTRWQLAVSRQGHRQSAWAAGC